MGSSHLIYVLKSASSSISAREDWSMNKRQESIWEETVEDQISFSCLGLWTFYIKPRIDPSVSSTSTDPPGSQSSRIPPAVGERVALVYSYLDSPDR